MSRNAARFRIRDSDLLVTEAGAGDPVSCCTAAAGRDGAVELLAQIDALTERFHVIVADLPRLRAVRQAS